ncbi:MAG: methyltransferase [Aureliella sp.]|jgi:2-polyprenyl-3-methyl-5-hydroxy-6-metoxy-1,4-benzoquinol methylase
MSESQKRTVARYQGFFEALSLSASLEAALDVGLLDALREGQMELEELARRCQCEVEPLAALMRVLVAVGIVERYGEDLALSQAAQLMAGPDVDLGMGVWFNLPDFLAGRERSSGGLEAYRRRISARQWSHTAAAMQAAEVLKIGTGLRGLKVLELGSGTGVWSAAMAYRDPTLHVTSVDDAARLAQCRATYASVELLERWTPIEDDYRTWSTPLGEFDLVILPEVLQLEQDVDAVILLGRAADALRTGGQVAIFDTLRESDGPTLTLATQALELAVATGGQQRSAAEIQRLLRGAGFGDAQWGWLTASSHGIGLIIASKE